MSIKYSFPVNIGDIMKHLDIPESCNKILLQLFNIKKFNVYANSSDLFTEITLLSKKEYYPYVYLSKVNDDHFVHIDFSNITHDLEIIIESEDNVLLNTLDYVSDEVILTFTPIPNNENQIVITITKTNSFKSIKIS